MTSDGESAWLLRWCDDQGISSKRALEKALQGRRKRQSLRDAMGSATFASPSTDDSVAAPLAAGASLDLSGSLDCVHEECLRDKVDVLFQRGLMYFDKMYVVGPPAHLLANYYDDRNDEWKTRVLHYAGLLFYLRGIGAERYLSFGEKPNYCTEHFEEHAVNVGLKPLYDAREAWRERLSTKADIFHSWDPAEKAWHVTVEHPDLNVPHWGYHYPDEDGPESSIHDVALDNLFNRYAGQLVADLEFAKECEAPLGSTTGMHEDFLLDSSQGGKPVPSEFDVAFNLPLPFIDRIPAKELIALRDSEYLSHRVFQSAVREAIQERLKAGAQGSDSVEIAIEIANDVLHKPLQKIESEMKNARDTMNRGNKFLGAAVATSLVTAGLTGAIPLLAGSILGVVAAAPDYRIYLQNQNLLKNHELYFMWRTSELAQRKP